MTITCSQCKTYMGETDRADRVIDLCRSCMTKWIAIEKQRVNLISKTMDATYSALGKEPRT